MQDNNSFRFSKDRFDVSLNGSAAGNGQLAVRPRRLSKKSLAAQALNWTGGGWMLRNLPSWRGLLILNYHRIGYPLESDFDRNLWSATPEDFAIQLDCLKRHFDVIGLSDLDEALKGARGRAVMITFDDGYRDNYTHAYTALRHYGLPATFFLTTGFLDNDTVPWWDEISWMVRNTRVSSLSANAWISHELSIQPTTADRVITTLLRRFKELQGDDTAEYLAYLSDALQTGRCPKELGHELWMTWDMVREMKRHGMTFGGHSVTHPVLSSISAEQQDYEVGEARRRLVSELGEPIDAFSYPVGGKNSFTQVTKDAVARHGYRWGFTYLGGYLEPGRFDPFALRRAAVEIDITRSLFRAMVTLPQYFA